ILGPGPAGEVVAVGDAVVDFQTGDRVVVKPVIPCGQCPQCQAGRSHRCVRPGVFGVHRPGGDAEYTTAQTGSLLRIPDALSSAAAAAMIIMSPPAWHLLATRGQLQRGETALIMGAAGALGTAGLQIAKYLGARTIAAAGADWKLDRLRELGADATV